jgi:quercetin dioxygenase-like cupin family protein
MKRAVALMVALAASVLVSVVPSSAQEPPITATPLTPRSTFPDNVELTVSVNGESVTVEPSLTAVVKFVLQPGAQFPWHTHAGPVVANVKRGTLVFVNDECEETTYPAGTAFIDRGPDVHSALNPSTTKETVVVGTFFNAPPAPDPLLIPATTPGCAA